MNKEQKVAILAVLFPCLVFGGSAVKVFFMNQPTTVTFTVFEKWSFIQDGKTITQILTWGDSLYGKYYFIGNWTNQFELDHCYQVTFVQRGYANHPWNKLIVIDWEEV